MSSPHPPAGAHAFVRLSDGLCHYRIDGPLEGPIVLLAHGATVAGWEFDRLVPHLVAAGLRCVRADLFGHGYSDRPRVPYEHSLFVRQLEDLLDALAIREPVHVLGHSLGATVVARLACRHPGRVASLVLAAPLVDFTASTPSAALLDYPMLGECLMWIWVMPMLRRRRRRNYRRIADGRFVGKFRDQLRKPGFERALLSLFRSGSLGNQIECYRELARHPRPTLLVRGAGDPIVSAAQVRTILALAPHVRYAEIESTAHAFLLTHPQMVAPLVIESITAAAADVAPVRRQPATADSA